MQTLLLDTQTWDLVQDINNNIAIASDPYSQAQDVASAIKLFQTELWYDTTQGVTYFQNILGKLPPLSLIKSEYVQAGLTVPGVTAVQSFLTAITPTRIMSGQVQITNQTGAVAVATF